MKVFVYGTLRATGSRSRLFPDGSQVFEECFIDEFDMLDVGSFPGVVPGCGRVRGETYEIDSDLLATLDAIEGFRSTGDPSNLYNRETVTVHCGDATCQAYVYVFNQDSNNYDVIHSGDWFDRDGPSNDRAGTSYWENQKSNGEVSEAGE